MNLRVPTAAAHFDRVSTVTQDDVAMAGKLDRLMNGEKFCTLIAAWTKEKRKAYGFIASYNPAAHLTRIGNAGAVAVNFYG
jgi:hypothetical protein